MERTPIPTTTNVEPESESEEAPVPRSRGRRHYFPGISDADWNDWRWQFRNRVTTLEELSRHITVRRDEWDLHAQILSDFRMGITPYYLSLIDARDTNDPLLRQVVPLREEYEYRAIGDEDPLGEEKFSPVPGITHRYPDRCLMVISNSCAIYCRYCTRKRIMYEDATPDVEIDRMVDYIARTPSIRDVVVSGGDPLTYSTPKLESILSKLRAIPHLEIIRIGTRVPVALPMRIDDELCAMLQKYHPLWINVHYNHPNELTADAARACDKLSRAGIPLNNQSVLLKGVNDDVATVKRLVHGLMKMRVRPYYLYQCDPVRGTEHFRTTIQKGIEIIEGLRGHTSGLAIPTYVVDAPGGGGKIPVGPQYLLHYSPTEGRAILRNFQGKIYEYFEPDAKRKLVPNGYVNAENEVAPVAETETNGNGHGHAATNGHANGHTNGHTNGHSNGHGNGNGHPAEAETGKTSGGEVPVVGKSKWAHKAGTGSRVRQNPGPGCGSV